VWAFVFFCLVRAPLAWSQSAGSVPSETSGTVPETIVSGATAQLPDETTRSVVRRSDFESRMSRSAPDALKFEPGVMVQQTSHGQASVFIRGLTGQQTVLIFDGIRLNTSTWRQGPNQYFFTVDNHSVESFELLRGGGSTWFGSDALGGVIAANPVETRPSGKPLIQGALGLRGTSADDELGGNARVSFSSPGLGFTGGFSGRRVSLLEAAGKLKNVDVPRFLPDGRTQRGTGFQEFTGDARLVVPVSDRVQFVGASYLYRQFDAPRTDRCPAPQAADDECQTIDEQFRTLVYAGLDGTFDSATVQARLSWQRQNEARSNVRPQSFVKTNERDTVDTFGFSFFSTLRKSKTVSLRLGLDAYVDRVDSTAFISFADINVVRQRSRGQYVAGSGALSGGAFADATWQPNAHWRMSAGARAGWSAVSSPGDAASASLPVSASWPTWAGHAALSWQMNSSFSSSLSVDRSFRAPNLDDLTSRQQTGPGFQFENNLLQPEASTALELAFKWNSEHLKAELVGFQNWLSDTIIKSYREVSQCPPLDSACASSRFRLTLENSRGLSTLRGLEAGLKVKLGPSFSLRTSAALTYGNDANGVPLSRIPPLNGTAELTWRPTALFSTTATARGALAQTRLALTDTSDARIPLGGTPGFLVFDIRMGAKIFPKTQLHLVFENIFDSVYRIHGSSINGAARGLLLSVTQEL
jgi:outer membrane receptor for ferrienterochelin and colicin